MKYIAISIEHGRLFLDCESLEVYNIPFGIGGTSKGAGIYSICIIACMLGNPLLFLLTKSYSVLFAMTLISMASVVLVYKKSAKTGEQAFKTYIGYYEYSRVRENVLNEFRQYLVKSVILTLLITLVILLMGVVDCYLLFTEKPYGYVELLGLNMPTYLLIFWGGFRPIATVKYYFKYKRKVNMWG